MTAQILIIDDEQMVRATLRQMLEREGYRVAEAANGRDGLRLAGQLDPDIVITDVIMPATDGIEVITELRRDHHHAGIIAMSGSARIGNLDLLTISTELGADRVLGKPIEKHHLLAAVRECLEAAAVV